MQVARERFERHVRRLLRHVDRDGPQGLKKSRARDLTSRGKSVSLGFHVHRLMNGRWTRPRSPPSHPARIGLFLLPGSRSGSAGSEWALSETVDVTEMRAPELLPAARASRPRTEAGGTPARPGLVRCSHFLMCLPFPALLELLNAGIPEIYHFFDLGFILLCVGHPGAVGRQPAARVRNTDTPDPVVPMLRGVGRISRLRWHRRRFS
jgi:hypothetical protein